MQLYFGFCLAAEQSQPPPALQTILTHFPGVGIVFNPLVTTFCATGAATGQTTRNHDTRTKYVLKQK